MNNEELLEQIKELFVTEREHTKKLLEANNTVLSTIFKVELAETNKRIYANKQDIKALKKGQERIEQKPRPSNRRRPRRPIRDYRRAFRTSPQVLTS